MSLSFHVSVGFSGAVSQTDRHCAKSNRHKVYGLTTFLGSSCRNVIRIIWRSETLFSLLSRREFHKFSSKTQNPASEYQNLLRTVDLIYLIKKDKKKSIGVSWPVVFDSMQNNIYNLILILENLAVFCV